jgi:hypothetical protein
MLKPDPNPGGRVCGESLTYKGTKKAICDLNEYLKQYNQQQHQGEE